MSSLLSIGTQALTANQSALSYTGQNIANVNTEGYSRQRVNFETQQPPILGVALQDVQRITDQFLVTQVWSDQSALSASEQQAQKVALLDKLMVSDSTNLSNAMDSYFESLQRAVDDPLFIANRQLFLTQAESLVATFQNFEQRLSEQQSGITVEARTMVSSVNTITSNIAQLNVKISSLASSGQNYNSLIDERDQLVKQLSSFVSVDVVSSDGGITANVLLANGEPLVTSGRAATLSIRDGSPDPLQIEVVLSRGNTQADITDLLGQGALGGLFSYRDDVLQPVRNEIGRLALVFTTTMNEQHRKGMDLDGNLGGDLFNEVDRGQVYASASNKTVLVDSPPLGFYDVSQLTGSDYELEITGVDSFRVRRLSDGVIFESNTMGSDLNNPGASGSFSSVSGELKLAFEGMTLNLKSSDSLKTGDRFLLQPTRNGAREMSLAITQPESLALASPLRVTPAASNAGNASVSAVEVLDASPQSELRPGQLNTPFEIVFNALDSNGDITYSLYMYDISDPSNPDPVTSQQLVKYQADQPITFSLNSSETFQVTLTNQPKPGDLFTIEYNEDGVSDNANALAMANLQKTETSRGYSYQDAYGQLLAKVGAQASSIQIGYSSNQAVLAASQNALESIRGVNLDEEATKLIQYQQAYTASTRLITAYQDLFDSLISAVR